MISGVDDQSVTLTSAIKGTSEAILMTISLGFPVFDADNHLYEPEEALTKYLPSNLRNLIRFAEINGRKRLLVRGQLTEFIPNPTFEVIARPGAYMDFYSGNNPDGKTLRELTGEPIRCPESFRDPAARVQLLDEQGVASCLMFPTLASLIEERLINDPDLTIVAIRAFNQWLYEQWQFDYQGRIFTTPIVNPCVVDDGIRELELALERGAKVVLLRPAPVSGLRGTRSPFLPEFDPFWARVQEAGVVVALHVSDSGYQKYVNTWQGTDSEFLAFSIPTFAAVIDGGRSIQDTLASAICHGMLHRFPKVRLLSVENGGGWVPVLLKQLEATYRKAPKEFPEHPVDTFRRSVWVNPFWEDSIASLVELIGAERVCFGSDFPHAEGLAEPLAFFKQLEGLDEETIRRIGSTNMYELVGVPPPVAA
jgi:predicted TIM-barrel fold metal-dependent hydrolase